MRAMAGDGDNGSATGEVASRLGGATNSFGPARANLIAKRAQLRPRTRNRRVTVPGMADLVQRQPQT